MKDERERAGWELLALPLPPGDGPEPDWEEQKREILDAPMRKLEGAWRGRVTMPDDFDDLPDDLADAFDGAETETPETRDESRPRR